MNDVGFVFPEDHSQQWDGFNEPGIEHFSGSPFRSLGREATQNALDAAKEGLPAVIKVRRIDVPTSSVPGVDALRTAIDCCNLEAQEEGEKAKQFFEAAATLLRKKNISVLQFSDANTKGVKGPCENGTPYFALMKATGQSKKEKGTSVGSFGIGKFAPFTVSGLRTTFITTVWEDDTGQLQHYVQGKSILMSHYDAAQKTFRGTGFWGLRENCQPLIGHLEELPEWLRRSVSSPDDTGTTISILGFLPSENWENVLAASIAESFFGAIHRGQLVVEIEGGPTLDASTLSAVFADPGVRASIENQKEEPETFDNSGHFLQVLSSSESTSEDTESSKLGHCRLHLLVGEGHPKKVAVLRNGMLITSRLAKLRRFSEFKEFAAVVECLSAKGNELLRSMEPPAHDDFEPDRLGDPKQGRAALHELGTWVRDMLKRHAQDPVKEVTEIDELAEFFGEGVDADGPGSRDGDENPRGAVSIRARPLPKKKPTVRTEDETGGYENDGGEGGSGSGPEGEGEGAGEEGTGGGGRNDATGGDKATGGAGGGTLSPVPVLPLRNVRAVVIGANRRRLAFTPDVSGTFWIALEDSGADSNRALPVLNASTGSVSEGRVQIACEANHRVVVDVDLQRPFEGTVRVRANAV
jgi:hypothetical protein